MADRYDDRNRPAYDRERQYNEDRGAMDRAGDEVRSWFGDEDAARRRERDERANERTRAYERGFASDRPERWGERSASRETRRPRDEQTGWREDQRQRRDTAYYRREVEMDLGGGSAIAADSGFGSTYGTGMGHARSRDESIGMGRGDGRSLFGRDTRQRGNYSGRGPKGYRRSDERIREDVSDRLTDDPMLDASDIEVTVSEAEVTLSGFIRDRDDKRRAEDIAEQVSGVREIHNSLRLRREVGDTAETSQQTSTAKAAER